VHVRFQGCNGIQIAQDEEEIGHTQPRRLIIVSAINYLVEEEGVNDYSY
jgi:hypothetical protein